MCKSQGPYTGGGGSDPLTKGGWLEGMTIMFWRSWKLEARMEIGD